LHTTFGSVSEELPWFFLFTTKNSHMNSDIMGKMSMGKMGIDHHPLSQHVQCVYGTFGTVHHINLSQVWTLGWNTDSKDVE